MFWHISAYHDYGADGSTVLTFFLIIEKPTKTRVLQINGFSIISIC